MAGVLVSEILWLSRDQSVRVMWDLAVQLVDEQSQNMQLLVGFAP